MAAQPASEHVVSDEEHLDSGGEAPEAQEAGGSAGGCAPPSEPPLPVDAELERQQQVRADIEARTQEILGRGAAYLAGRSLSDFNADAAAQQKAGQHAAAVATYSALFVKAKQANLTHPELYICHSNCSAAYLALGLHDEALHHAVRCQQLARASLRRNYKGSASYVKSFLRKGRALMGLGRNREAAVAFDEGLKYDPHNLDLKYALQLANEAVVKDLAEGKGRETKAIEYPEPRQRISFHPYAAPLHKIKTDDMLPLKLLTPFQGENDHHIKDTYNYATVQTDIRMPGKHLRQLEDGYALPRFRAAIEAAVQAIAADDKDCRVLNLGAGAGLHSMLALRAGARHATAVERWLYLALACKECMLANEFTEEQFKVVYKRATDLKLKEDLAVCCNLLIANVLDEGLLTSGLIPCVRHALDAGLLTSDAILLPSSATVYMQAIEIRTGEVCGLDMSAANLYRWHLAFAAGAPLASERVVALSEPQEVWHFDLGAPPDKSDVKTVDVEFTRRGRFNAVMFWYKLHLFGDVYFSTGPEAVAEGLRSLQPAVQYIAGELSVAAGNVLPVVASHNTVRLRFDVESAEFLNLHKPDASFPHCHFAMLADEERCQAYKRAIERAVAKRRAADREAHVLDIGAGSGVLALLAARAGADSVVACELHGSLCDVARKAVAANGLSKTVSVVHRDAATLQRGREIRTLGVNVVVADVFDAGLIGDGFPYLLDLTRRKVVQPGATVVPAAATLYCMGVEALTGRVAGLDMSPMNTYRWDAGYQAISLGDLPHRRLTKPTRVMEIAFDGESKSRGRESMLKLEVVEEGLLNAVVFWFDLHLDDCETLTNAPAGIGEAGVLLCQLEAGSNDAPPEAPSTPASAAQEQQEPQAEAAAAAAAAADGSSAAEAQGAAAAAEQHEEQPLQEPQQAEQEEFVPADSFAGARPGYAFKLGDQGLGYYIDSHGSADGGASTADGAVLAAAEAALQRQVAGPAAVGSSALAALTPTEPEAPLPGPLPAGPRHHWGQALQYLDRAVPVAPGRRLALLARREEGKLRFALRQGVGEYVPRAPWKIEWGGGSSVENPHFQRVHYCQLLVSDFLQRVKSRRFPPIEKDMRMVLAHCGSLLLDPAALQEVTHELVLLEALQLMQDFSPAASVEAMTKPLLRMC